MKGNKPMYDKCLLPSSLPFKQEMPGTRMSRLNLLLYSLCYFETYN